jgi:DeoR/GlpR family transcriptional regulator of sugar metabolism
LSDGPAFRTEKRISGTTCTSTDTLSAVVFVARRQEIQRRLTASGEVTITALAADLEVSEMTIRRDLEVLENQGQLRRVRGGAISVVSRSYEPPFAARQLVEQAAKQAIGAAAARLVDDGETVIIDVGTTALEFARNLKGRRGITVVTHSLPVAMELGNESDIRVLVTGGMVRSGEFGLSGGVPEATFADVNCDVVFLGVAGIQVQRGLTEYNPADALVKKAALRAARRSVILADRSKLDKVTFHNVAPLASVDILVTDACADEPYLEAIRSAGVEVITTGEHNTLGLGAENLSAGLETLGRRRPLRR